MRKSSPSVLASGPGRVDVAGDRSAACVALAAGSGWASRHPGESQAIRALLGPAADRVAVSATKPFYGHALGASGAFEVGISAMAIHKGWVPPTLNLQTPGEGCDLSYVRGSGQESDLGVVLSNSFGFGGINACVVLEAPESTPVESSV